CGACVVTKRSSYNHKSFPKSRVRVGISITASRSQLAFFCLRRFLSSRLAILVCGSLISLAVAARDGACRPADIVVDVIFQVCERYAHRPVRSGKAATIEQNDAVILGQPEHDVERMHVLLHPLDDVLAQILAGKEFEVDEAVVVVEVLIRSYFDVQTL